jgi:hypothetical protein
MNDKALLEFAAKAANIRLGAFVAPRAATTSDGLWAPLDDDGDALRLAVKLDIDFYQGDDDGPAMYAGYFIGVREQWCIEQHGVDKQSAARRAIVRAAAEIGKAMQG